MTVARRVIKRFTVEGLLAPRSVAAIGIDTPNGLLVARNLQDGDYQGTVTLIGDADGDPAAAVAALPEAPELAIVSVAEAEVGLVLQALAARGTFAAAVTSQVADLGRLATQAGIRVLGPRSFGVAAPSIGLNASLSHMKLPRGRIALVTQSASLTRAVVDWAGPNGVGFSHVAGIGGNANIGFSRVLDWLSRDAATGLIMIDIRRVRARRAFISAARAASRLRPVVALRPGGRLLDPSGRSDAVFAAALRRAGVFVVEGLESFLAAAEVLSRARPLRGDALAVVTNAIGPGRLAADAALRAGIKLAVLPSHAQEALAGTMPAELTQGLIYAGGANPMSIADIAAMVSAVPEVGGVLVMLSPTGDRDSAAIEGVIAAAASARMPVLSCIMGETSGAGHRFRLAEAGLPAFATPEQAVQGFGHLLRDRRAREASRELPPGRVLSLTPDHAAVHAILEEARAGGRSALSRAESLSVLAAYGIRSGAVPEGVPMAAIHTHDDLMFGPAIGFASPPQAPFAYDLPPLNLPLAQDLAANGGAGGAQRDHAADLLVRVSQLLVDEPSILGIGIDRLALDDAAGPVENKALVEDAAIWLRPPGDAAVLAIPPYPEQLIERWGEGGAIIIRPIRPEDAAAHADMIRRVPPEDLRYRFFTAMRQVAPEQMARLTQIDYEREMAFIAVRAADNATVGVARLVREFDPAEAEFAILVEPSVKGSGLASALMERLFRWGRDQGVRRIVGQVLADNAPMIGFVRHLGFAVHGVPGEADIVEAVLELAGPEAA